MNIHEYTETALIYSHELFDCGMTREAESHAYNCWNISVRLGLPSMVLKAVNFLLFMKTVTVNDRIQIAPISAFLRSLLKPNLLNTIRTPQKKPSSLISRLSLVFDTLIGERPQDEMSIIVQPDISKSISIEKHADTCSCPICELAQSNWNFNLDMQMTILINSCFTTTQFAEFVTAFNVFKNEYLLKDREMVYEKSPLNEMIPPHMLRSYLRAIITFEKFRNKSHDYVPNFEIFSEALKLCNNSPLTHRCQLLVLNQLLRPKIYSINASWYLAEKTSNMDPSSIADKLIKCFNSLSLSSTKRPQDNTVINNSIGTRRNSKRKQVQAKDDSTNTILQFLKDARFELENFKHLFLRNWRFNICLYLAMHENDPWTRAYYFIESQACGIREYTRFLQPKISNDCHFEDVLNFKNVIKQLPEDLTVIQLTIDEDRNLWLTRLNSGHDSISIPLRKIEENDEIILRMQQILIKSDETVSRTKNQEKSNKTSKEFWESRRQLNSQISVLLNDLENQWFGHWINLLIPLNFVTPNNEKLIKKLEKIGFSTTTATILIRLIMELNEESWKSIVRLLSEFEGVSDSSFQSLLKNYAFLKSKTIKLENSNVDLYTILILPPELSFLPFECLPIFQQRPLVCRITSFHLFQRLLQRTEKITDKFIEKYRLPKKVDSRNSYYVLNPSGDLEQTQKRLETAIETMKWTGLVGKPPTVAEFKTAIEQNDLFLYFGHGSGSKYFGRSAVRQSDCKAVSILMGCASVRIQDEGRGFDGRSVIHDYTIARCPCLVGCLWMVTDGEIDRFFLALVNFCFTQPQRSPLKEKQLTSGCSKNERIEESYKLLIQGIVHARNACKLPYLTGSAVVCYGLPVASILF